MPKNQIEVNTELLERIRPLAIKNGIKPTVSNLVHLCMDVAVRSYENLDTESFAQVCNLKK
jgi:uncharacterized protein YydD (DUF2326 family)